MHQRPHNKMQIRPITTSIDHAALNSFVENVELSLQPPVQGHMLQFLQQSHTMTKREELN